jgi:hypothetical protein
MKLEVRNIKKNRGREGDGYSGTLYVDGVKAAIVDDFGDGGAARWTYFVNGRAWGRNPELEARLDAHCATLPPRTAYGMTLPVSRDVLFEDLVQEAQWRRACQTKTLFRLVEDGDDKYRELRQPFSPQVAAQLRAQFAARLVEIINERFVAAA